MFYSRTKPRPGKPAANGKPIKNEYKITVDEYGHKSVSKKSETNLYAKIQEALPNVLIDNIIKRHTLGDPTALNKYAVQFMDVTGMPATLAEAQQSIINMESIFSSLPLNIRAQYNHNPKEFIADFGSSKFNEIFGIGKEKPTSTPLQPSPTPTEPTPSVKE